MDKIKTVLVTGGAGYVGAVLVPKLLKRGYKVKVIDLFIYGKEALSSIKGDPKLCQIAGDIRDQELLKKSLEGCEAVIHLACISNDPSFELNPDVSRSINFEAFEPLANISKRCGVRRFIYASTCSVYGLSDAENVTEDHPLVPITDYNKYKGLCEPILLKHHSTDFTAVVIRPATICGYSPRQRLDLTVNTLTAHAFHLNRITVFGGAQTRPNIHVDDITDLYVMLLELPKDRIAGKIYNAGRENCTIDEIAERVAAVILKEFPERKKVEIARTPSNDPRSYRISSAKIKEELGFLPQRTIESAVSELVRAFKNGLVPNAMEDARYYNIRLMKSIKLA